MNRAHLVNQDRFSNCISNVLNAPEQLGKHVFGKLAWLSTRSSTSHPAFAKGAFWQWTSTLRRCHEPDVRLASRIRPALVLLWTRRPCLHSGRRNEITKIWKINGDWENKWAS